MWKLNEHTAVVLTTDFFTPVVDDPYAYGAIAAANSISDIYAMGAKPVLALNIAALPADLPVELLRDIMRGAADKCHEAGVVIAGGHTVTDPEPKFGLAVLGLVNPADILTKKGLQSGDALFLSKPLGIGVSTTALKRGKLGPDALQTITEWMMRLNKDAAELAEACDLQAVTDITGFGLMGHASKWQRLLALGWSFGMTICPSTTARKLVSKLSPPGGAFNNRIHFGKNVFIDPELSENQHMVIFDPQTSGGLLMGVPAEKVSRFKALANERGVDVWEIGRVLAENEYRLLSQKPV